MLFPPKCLVCDEKIYAHGAQGICSFCCNKVVYVHSPLCLICGRTFEAFGDEDHICEKCLRTEPPYCLARAVTIYADPVNTLLHRLKYKFDTSAVPPLLKIAQSFDFSPFETCNIIIPVPLHPRRLKKRGLNHALILARLFFPNKKEFIQSNILLRTLDTISQTRLNGVARRENLRSAFSVRNKKLIENASVCLVDDILTTGTTVIECSKALKEAGAVEVRVLTMARVEEVR